MNKKIQLLLLTLLCGFSLGWAQYGVLSPLHVSGSKLQDEQGNHVVLHGVMDTPSPYFNNGRWGSSANTAYASKCISYFDQLFTAITSIEDGAACNVFRLHLDPCWCFVNAADESDFEKFQMSRFKSAWEKIYQPIIETALGHGLYVVVRPPGVCPQTIQVGGAYQEYLNTIWEYVAADEYIRQNAGYISLELANEPVDVKDANGNNQNSGSTLRDFFQPLYDTIRQQGFTGIVWAPGAGYQSIYTGYDTYPMEGYNIGYAVHCYPGWYSCSDTSCDPDAFINNFTKMVPVAGVSPIIITEVDWSPEKEGEGKYNEFGEWVPANWGTWGTASTSKWGAAFKALIDYYDASMTLSSTGVYLDIDSYILNGTVQPAIKDVEEACGPACWDWYQEYAKVNYAYPSFTNRYCADQGNGTYINPIINADFPDPDPIRVGDTFYMSTTTMFHFPGATIMKSKDLVNWEYCCNPLENVINNEDAFSLKNDQNRYAQGMWASTLNYYDGRYYLGFLVMGSTDGTSGYYMLDTDDIENGTWRVRMLKDGFYDAGILFDNDGKVYIAAGINHITVFELDPNNDFSIKGSKEVIVRDDSGLEGNHMYHIGDYYYIYSTYGGTEGSQTIFRSSSPMGDYEECNGRLIANQSIHQGGLVDTPNGEWWTILFKDDGAVGRVPYLEPVTWNNGWPTIGNNGIDVCKDGAAYPKPNVGLAYPRTYIPTNDTFTSLTLGMQWQWSHLPDNSAWSLTEHPGYLRLYTTGIASDLKHARNSLTQRMQCLHYAGTANSKKNTVYGTTKMEIGGMNDGDLCGLAMFQDPYSYVAVKQENGKRRIVVYCEGYDNNPEQLYDGDEITGDVIYLQARASMSNNLVTYWYSTDNVNWERAVNKGFTLRYIISIFVGQRFYLFNYATEKNGGFVDIDWFSTEQEFEESRFYSEENLQTFSPEDLIFDHMETVDEIKMLNGAVYQLPIYAVMASGMTMNVASSCSFTIEDEDIATIANGVLTGKQDGKTTIRGTYTDYDGMAHDFEFPLSVETFPLTADFFNPSLTGSGTFDETTGEFTTSKNGLAGWEYSNGLDINGYNYIVIELESKPTVSTSFCIYDQANGSYSRNVTSASSKVTLTANAVTSKVDLTKVAKMGFTTNGGATITINRVFLSMDGENPAGIDSILIDATVTDDAIYDIMGRRLSRAPEHGFYIQGGKKHFK